MCIIGLSIVLIGFILSSVDLGPTPNISITATATSSITSTSSQVEIVSPLPNSEITSPLVVSGRLRGGWFFEANAGLAVLDANKTPITTNYVTATTDWMTADWVSFTGTTTYPASYKGQKGYIQISNDNPSGMPENSKTFLIPVLFR